jgi:hypothetical protein
MSSVRPRATASRVPSGETAAAVTGFVPTCGGSFGVASDVRIDASCCGPGAPAAIHALSVATSAADGCGSSSGGMWSPAALSIRLIMTEPAGSPGFTGSPDSAPPRRSVANRSTDSSPSLSASLWQPEQ